MKDIIKALNRVLMDESIQGKIYDVGGPEIITYQGLIKKAGQIIKKNSTMITLNIIPLALSRFWVSLVTG
ncbi:MAG: hypothetical protein ACOYOJ_18690, partial [Alsobacter sp.]